MRQAATWGPMAAPFEAAPSPYHLSACSTLVLDAAGEPVARGRPAVERRLGWGAVELGADHRRCAAHASEPRPGTEGRPAV